MSSIAAWKPACKEALVSSSSLGGLVSEDEIEKHCSEAKYRWRRSFWSPAMTVLTFLLQALSSAKTVRAGVAAALAHVLLVDPRTAMPSSDPSAYGQARQRLPAVIFARIFENVVKQLRSVAGDTAKWCGRRVILIDGSSVSMPDVPELQRAFPQPHGQRPGCGFPTARLEALFCWGTGAVIDWRMGSLRASEASLFRQMFHHFKAGDVALADRYYCSYVDIARLTACGTDVVFRLHQSRSADFREGARLGPDDQLVEWNRPPWQKSFGVTREEFEKLSEHMILRMIRTTRAVPGFRSTNIVIVTTILDPAEASANQLLALYRDRWLVEVNLRSLKTTFGMEILRGHSVDVVRKEILVHCILYNMIRILMTEAARRAGREPRRISFAGTLHRLQLVAAFLLSGRGASSVSGAELEWLLDSIAQDLLPDRPDRVEPRRVKRRPKPYPRLMKPRAKYRPRSR